MRLTLVYKLSLSAAFLVLLSTSMVAYLFYTKTSSILVEHVVKEIANQIQSAGQRLEAKIKVQRNDVIFLANTPPIQGMLRALKAKGFDKQGKSSYQQWLQRLQDIFSNMITSKFNYLKIRYIDSAGKEIIVVRREGSRVAILNDKQLQDKSHRIYVAETIRLSVGSVYVSEFNLNREYEKVSEPYQEVLRVSTPIYDKKLGGVKGFVIITSEMGHELREIQDNIKNRNRNVYITNNHGSYLFHPDIQKRYGFDLGKNYRIQDDIPGIANFFLSNNIDKYFIQTPKDSNSKFVVNVIKIYFDPAKPKRFIAVGMTKLLSSIAAEQSNGLNDVVFLVFSLSCAVILLSIVFSYRFSLPIIKIIKVMDDYTNQRESTETMPIIKNDEIGMLARSFNALMSQVEEAQEIHKELNLNLEVMVAERTQALNISEIRQRSIVENMVDGIITITEDGFIESFNPAAEKIFRYTEKEVLGKNIKILMPEPHHSEHGNYLENYHKTGIKKIIGFNTELEALRKDGKSIPVEITVSEIFMNDHFLYTGVIRDITERKEMLKMKDEFISTVSHELRTPLTSIRGSIGLLISGVVGELPESVLEMVKIAGNNTDRLLFLINDILDIQKIESGKLDFIFKKIDLISFLEHAVEDNASYGELYDVKFVLEHDFDSVCVLADTDRLMQVMSNLLSNAAKFSPKFSNVIVSLIRKNELLRIVVTDHGNGIPEEFQSKLFEKFTQSDSGDNRSKGGTGLGLSIAKFIVEEHDGEIGFITKQGEGTSFYFELKESK